MADAACVTYRLKAERSDALVDELEIADEQLGICTGRLLELREAKPRAAPLGLRLVLDVGIAASFAGVGAAAGVGAPGEVIAAGAAVALGTLIGRIVLELIRW